MFEAKLTDARFWKVLMTAISTIIEEGIFKVDSNEVFLRTMDPSHVAMVEFSLKGTAFEHYRCDVPTKFCTNLSEMLKMLRGVEAGESLYLSLDEIENKLRMKIEGRYIRTFDMSLLEIPEEEAPAPEFRFTGSVKMLSEDFVKALDDAKNVSDSAKLHLDEDKFVITASGDIGSIKVEFHKGSKSIIELALKETSKASFDLRYLRDIAKAGSAISNSVKIEYSTDKPIKLDFEIPQGYLRFYLAPRIEM